MTVFAERSKLIATWVEVTGLVAAGIFALIQYQAHRSEVRAEKAIEFLQRWSEEPVSDCYERFSAAWNDPRTIAEWQASLAQSRQDPDAMEPEGTMGRLVLRIVEENKLRQSIYRLNEFYATAAACAQRHVCDRELVLDFFCQDATTFAERTRPLIRLHRSTDPDYARGLQNMVQLCETRSPAR